MLVLEIAGGITLAFVALAVLGVTGNVLASFAEHRALFPKPTRAQSRAAAIAAAEDRTLRAAMAVRERESAALRAKIVAREDAAFCAKYLADQASANPYFPPEVVFRDTRS